MQDTYNVVERSLWEFLQEIQKAVKLGYVLSDENKHFPQAHISLFTVTLVKPEECQHDWCFNGESSDGLEAEFQCSKCGEISITKKPVAETDTVVADVTIEVAKKPVGRPKSK